MKKYSNPNVIILYLSTNDIMQTSAIENFQGDGAEWMPTYWEGLIDM